MGLTLVAFAGFGLVSLHPSAPIFLDASPSLRAARPLHRHLHRAAFERGRTEAQGRVQGGDQALQGLTFAVVPVLATQLYAQRARARPIGSHVITAVACSDSAPGESYGRGGILRRKILSAAHGIGATMKSLAGGRTSVSIARARKRNRRLHHDWTTENRSAHE